MNKIANKHIPAVQRLITNCREWTEVFNFSGLIFAARADEVLSLCDEMEAAINKANKTTRRN